MPNEINITVNHRRGGGSSPNLDRDIEEVIYELFQASPITFSRSIPFSEINGFDQHNGTIGIRAVGANQVEAYSLSPVIADAEITLLTDNALSFGHFSRTPNNNTPAVGVSNKLWYQPEMISSMYAPNLLEDRGQYGDPILVDTYVDNGVDQIDVVYLVPSVIHIMVTPAPEMTIIDVERDFIISAPGWSTVTIRATYAGGVTPTQNGTKVSPFLISCLGPLAFPASGAISNPKCLVPLDQSVITFTAVVDKEVLINVPTV